MCIIRLVNIFHRVATKFFKNLFQITFYFLGFENKTFWLFDVFCYFVRKSYTQSKKNLLITSLIFD